MLLSEETSSNKTSYFSESEDENNNQGLPAIVLDEIDEDNDDSPDANFKR